MSTITNSINRGEIEYRSSTYQEIKRYLEEEVEFLRRKNDSTNLTEAETAALRGQIKENESLRKKLAPQQKVSTAKMRS